MKYKILIFFCFSKLYSAPPVRLSGLLSSQDLTQNIVQAPTKKLSHLNLSGEISAADLSKLSLNKVSAKQMVRLNGLLSANQLNSTIQFMHTKQQQVKNISGMISQKDLDSLIVFNKKKRKPRVNLSGLMVQNYLDPDYQQAFKILNNPKLKQAYDAQLEVIQTSFKEYYLSQTTSEKKSIINIPKVCCSNQSQGYSLCPTEQ